MHKTIFWFRRDLRLSDNHGLHRALVDNEQVQPIFIFDTQILDELDNPRDRRVAFIHQTLIEMDDQLKAWGSGLRVFYGKPLEIYEQLVAEGNLKNVYTNRDYEPYAKKRDKEIYDFLKQQNISFKGFKDQVIFEKSEVVKSDGDPYVVYTPYSKVWRSKFSEEAVQEYSIEPYKNRFVQEEIAPIPSLASMGFESITWDFPSKTWDEQTISKYDKQRNFPAVSGTSRLSVHLRFGTISIRELVRKTWSVNDTFINELIWRDFYQMILYHFPRVVNQSFREKYDLIEWRNDEAEFEAWCQGKTGFPIVDAGMRELVESGYMHNRVRMITASFLTKHLLIDWRWGEAFFAKHLLDFDLAANNGGWQWAAGSGTDAAPYFRIFNPTTQIEKFDPNYTYIKKWVPEWGTEEYPDPIVDHKEARARALETYKAGLETANSN